MIRLSTGKDVQQIIVYLKFFKHLLPTLLYASETWVLRATKAVHSQLKLHFK
jgi:hypothetical protein